MAHAVHNSSSNVTIHSDIGVVISTTGGRHVHVASLHLRNTQALECLVLNPFLRNSKQYLSLIAKVGALYLALFDTLVASWSLAPFGFEVGLVVTCCARSSADYQANSHG